MKKLMFLFVGLSVLFFTQCDKDESNADWTTPVAGTYTGTAISVGQGFPAVTTVSRINDTLLNLQLTFSTDTFCLDSVKMTSDTIMLWHEHDACYAKVTEGSGVYESDSSRYSFASADTNSTVFFYGTK